MATVPTNGDDRLEGTVRADTIKALDGEDKVFGFGRRDDLFGQAGDDKLFGGDGADRLIGGRDDDRLKGEDGNDNLFGGAGFDNLAGGRGDDVMVGGGGADTFNFLVDNTSFAGFDTILDYNTTKDFIRLGNANAFDILDTNNDFPETRLLAAAVVAFEALKAAWPCKP